MKAFKIVKQKKLTKDKSREFTTYLAVVGNIDETQKPFAFTSEVNYVEVYFTKKFKEENKEYFDKLTFPLTILNPIRSGKNKEGENIEGNYYRIPKKDKDGKFIKNKNNQLIYAIYIDKYDKDKFVNEEWEEYTKNQTIINEEDDKLPF